MKILLKPGNLEWSEIFAKSLPQAFQNSLVDTANDYQYIVRRSLLLKPGPSKPMTPPHRHTGFFFGLGQMGMIRKGKKIVDVGVIDRRTGVPAALERGGPQWNRLYRRFTYTRPRPFAQPALFRIVNNGIMLKNAVKRIKDL